jgi:ER membrane protein complex subunit 3
MGEHLVLDPAIRNWCLFPLMIVMILVSVLKHYINVLLQSEKPADVEDLRLK